MVRAAVGAQGVVWFAGFRFDPGSGHVSHDADAAEVALRPKTAAVLNMLVARAGEVVPKRELIESVWPDGFVGDAALTRCVNELRQALGDDPREPNFIATIHRRGYRFVASVSPTPEVETGVSGSRSFPFVGREGELAILDDWWRQASSGAREVVFVAAPVGGGKTTLVDRFVDGLRGRGGVLVGRGQCVEQFGGGEPYLPLLDALFGLCRGPDGRQVVEVLRTVAPTWLLQLPGVIDPGEFERLQARAVGMSAERMLREFGVAVEALTAERSMVLVCEDLHLGDRATAEALAYLARRREPARLMVVGTYRSTEAQSRNDPVRRVVGELRAHHQCRWLPLEPLGEAAVTVYLRERLGGEPAAALVAGLSERTDGNALFLATLVDHLAERDLLVDVAGELRPQDRLDRLGIPESVGQFIELQLDELGSDDRQLLEVAAAVGVEFTAESVRAGASVDQPQLHPAEVDARLAKIAHDGSIVVAADVAEWPDGTRTARYRFRHGLYQEVLYGQLPRERATAIHCRIGERLAAGYGSAAAEIAAELAMHFECGDDHERAIPHFVAAAEAAQRRIANHEILDYATRGLAQIQRTDDTPEHAALELRLRMLQLVAMVSLRGLRGEGVAAAHRQARTACQQVEDPTLLGPVLYGLWRIADAGDNRRDALELADEFNQLAHRNRDPVLQLQAHYIAGINHVVAGEYAEELAELERCLELYDPAHHRQLALLYGLDPAVAAHTDLAWVTWYLGYPERARRHAHQACTLARDLGYPTDIYDATSGAAAVSAFCRDVGRVRQYVAAAVEAHHHYGLTRSIYHVKVLDAWALAQVGEPPSGISVLPDGPAELSAGARTNPVLIAMRAETVAARGDIAAALALATEALDTARSTGDLEYEPELVRLRGELLLASATGAPDSVNAAEQAFVEARDIARRRNAKSLELRAATSLAELWQAQGKRDRARELLAGTYGWFTEGHDTHDLQRADALLAELG